MDDERASHIMTQQGYSLMNLLHGYYVIPVAVYKRIYRANKIYFSIIAVKAILILFLSLTHGGIQCLS